MSRDPNHVRAGRNYIMSGHPNIRVSIKAVVASSPNITRAGGNRNDFAPQWRRGTNSYDNLSLHYAHCKQQAERDTS
jgi:hypothetical protein